MSGPTKEEMYARVVVLENQMAVVAKAIELMTRGLLDDAAKEISKIL